MKKLNVMIVDDSMITIRKITEMVLSAGHNVVGHARLGNAAIGEYKNLKPDIVTMDITMPDIDGIEATKRLMAIDPNALIVMVTSHGQEKMVLDSIEAGAKGYLLKPLDSGRLKEILEEVYEKYGGNNAGK